VREEVRGDVGALMKTLVPEPVYEIWGASDSAGPKGYDEVEAFYEASIAIGKNRLEFEISAVLVEHGLVATEGIFRHAYDGELLTRRGFAAADVEHDAWYLVEYRALILWPIDANGLIEGERMYVGEKPRIVRRLEPGECDHLGPVDRG